MSKHTKFITVVVLIIVTVFGGVTLAMQPVLASTVVGAGQTCDPNNGPYCDSNSECDITVDPPTCISKTPPSNPSPAPSPNPSSKPSASPSLVPVCARGGVLPPGEPDPTSLDCLLKVGVNVVKLILGVSGSLALVYFLYGGFLWLTAAGVPKRVEDGKTIIVNSMIGLVIIFGAFMLIQFVVKALGVGAEFTNNLPQVEKFK